MEPETDTDDMPIVQQITEIDEAAREVLDEMGEEHDVEVSKKSKDLVVDTLLTFSERPTQDWVAGLHESMVDPGRGAHTDVSVACGVIVGETDKTPRDIYTIVNGALERKYNRGEI